MISAGIGMVNLFPLPMLDGGHLCSSTRIEAIHPPSAATPRYSNLSYRAGLVLIITLVIYTNANDALMKSTFTALESGEHHALHGGFSFGRGAKRWTTQ